MDARKVQGRLHVLLARYGALVGHKKNPSILHQEAEHSWMTWELSAILNRSEGKINSAKTWTLFRKKILTHRDSKVENQNNIKIGRTCDTGEALEARTCIISNWNMNTLRCIVCECYAIFDQETIHDASFDSSLSTDGGHWILHGILCCKPRMRIHGHINWKDGKVGRREHFSKIILKKIFMGLWWFWNYLKI